MPNPLLSSDAYWGGTELRPIDAGTGHGLRGGRRPAAVGDAPGWGAPPVHAPVAPAAAPFATMTVGGTVVNAVVMLLFVLGGGALGWSVIEHLSFPVLWFLGVWFVASLLAAVVHASPRAARNLAIPYALFEGVILGVVSRVFDESSHGIVLQAILTTVAVFATMLGVSRSRVIRVTPRLARGIIAAVTGVGIVYLVGLIALIVSKDGATFMNQASPIGIAISVVCAAVAAFCFLLDFDVIERGVAQGIRKEWEWFGAFGVVTTLVWLYVEMLKLVFKIRQLV